MAVSIFDTRSMFKQVEYIFVLKTPFLNMFFTETRKSQTEYIDIDFVRHTRKLAPYVGPQMEAKVRAKLGFERRSVQPPYIKEKDVTTAEDLLRTQPGQHIYLPGKTGVQLAREELAKALQKFINEIIRRTEFMAHEALSTQGPITYSGEGILLTVDFNMQSSHKITLTSTAKWDDYTNSNPLANLKTWHQLIKKDSGLVPRIVMMDVDATALFMNHPKIVGAASVFQTDKVQLGQIKPAELPNGLEYIGTLRHPNVDLFSYSEYYDTEGGTTTPIMTSKTLIMGSREARCIQHYAAIKDLKARTPVKWFPSSWTENDPSARFLMVQSSPLMAPHQIDGFLHATVA